VFENVKFLFEIVAAHVVENYLREYPAQYI